MYQKTTNFNFTKYGEVIPPPTKKITNKLFPQTLKLKEKNFTYYMQYHCDVIIKVLSGIVMIVCSNDLNNKESARFIIEKTIKIKKGIRFNFLCITSNAKVELIPEGKSERTMVPTFLKQPIALEIIRPTLQIKEIFAYFYEVKNYHYKFLDEKSEHWELVFIDNGSMTSRVNGHDYQLKTLDFILFSPQQKHHHYIDDHQSCSYFSIIFDMDISDNYILTNRVYQANRDIHQIINKLIRVSENNKLYDYELMLCYLKELLIKTLQFDFNKDPKVNSTPAQQTFDDDLLNEIIAYINDELCKQLTIEEICTKFSISRSSLQTLFNNNIGTAPKRYISELKLHKSKILIKENKYTISEISSMLGFASIHYFSRSFKQRFGITPSDYAKTLYS